jgi:hypothetical protein
MASDIEEVYQQEVRRGKRPKDIQTKRERDTLRKALKRFIEKRATEEQVVGAIAQYLNLPADAPAVLVVVELWREVSKKNR